MVRKIISFYRHGLLHRFHLYFIIFIYFGDVGQILTVSTAVWSKNSLIYYEFKALT